MQAIEYIKKTNLIFLVLDMSLNPGIDGLGRYKEKVKIHQGLKTIIARGFC